MPVPLPKPLSAGRPMAASRPIIAMTTSNSTRVNAACEVAHLDTSTSGITRGGAQVSEPALSSPLKTAPGAGTGPTTHAVSRRIIVGRLVSRGEQDVFKRAVGGQ